MTLKPKPVDQPEPSDMSEANDKDGEAATPAATHPTLQEQKEEEAERLGNFA